jgi:zinc transporter ZupT
LTEISVIILVILAFIFGALFFVADYFEHEHHQLHASLIAGISLSYFFLVVLPEISEGLPEYPLHLRMFEYLFILIGIMFVHVSEKIILQKVEAKSQKRMRKLIKMESDLEMVEKNIEHVLHQETAKDVLDKDAIKEITRVMTELTEKSHEIMAEINEYKTKIQNHINKDLAEFRFFTNFSYHFLIGIILVGLLFIEFIGAFLFFIFAWFRTIVTNRKERHIIFTDLDIYEISDFNESQIKKVILALSVLIGVIFGLMFEFILPLQIELELIYLLYSFISGVILYTIIREVAPERELGSPLLFLIGAIGFAVLIFIIRITLI